ncbi:hypothetical protein KIW84_012742 [Lathyrus oleraceus]|uniref:SKP1-like protein n=1 Tax=Pisum sativum TaxID=3888 RepID=A0A9D5BIG7_PEA|nr:hypothetical protein KIW84_012742 [Pisum sativum]
MSSVAKENEESEKKAYLVFELEDGSIEEVEEEAIFKEVSRRILEEQTPEEISRIIDLCENITKEKKLEPDTNKITDDPRMRLLNKLHAKKEKELKEKMNFKKSTSQDHATTPKDELSEDDFDPALKEKLDREVEEFARILNLDRSERIKMFN